MAHASGQHYTRVIVTMSELATPRTAHVRPAERNITHANKSAAYCMIAFNVVAPVLAAVGPPD